jgi:hypothetical protein
MHKLSINTACIFLIFIVAIITTSCSKSSPGPSPASMDPCVGKTIKLTSIVTNVTACAGNGSIKATATGSTGFTYKLNAGGTYQTDDSFGNVAAGAYTLFAKDAGICEQSIAVTVGAAGATGPLFTAVKNLMASKCQSCHNNSVQNGGMNWEVECNIISKADRVKTRAVTEGSMPPTGALPQADKNIISAWITAGGGYTN